MLSFLPLAVLIAAQGATPVEAPGQEDEHGFYGPAVPAPPKPKVKSVATEPCKVTEAKDVKDDTREIVVCAQKVEGYRINPDVLKAQRLKKKNAHPRRPERLVDTSCASVGPMGCTGGAGINLIAAALTAATMVQKAVSGENVGEMFITDPQPDEYKLYLQAKREREAAELEEAEKAKAKAKAGAEAAETSRTPVTR
jgi:hypothetical protein